MGHQARLTMAHPDALAEWTEWFREFVLESKWTYAKTMPQFPHHYTLRRNTTDEKFDKAVIGIREHGVIIEWHKTYRTYFIVDGFRYWTMGSPLRETILINRAVHV